MPVIDYVGNRFVIVRSAPIRSMASGRVLKKPSLPLREGRSPTKQSSRRACGRERQRAAGCAATASDKGELDRHASGQQREQTHKGIRIHIDCPIKNYGRTPAVVTDLRLSFAWREDCPKINEAEPFDNFIELPLEAGEENEGRPKYRRSFFVTEDELGRIYAQEGRIYLWGRITYRDVFGNEWYTNFGRELGLWPNGKSRLYVSTCPELNKST